MPRTTQWYRGNDYTQFTDFDTPWIVPLAGFGPGETLIRTRLDIQLVGAINAAGTHFPSPWEGVQVEIALLWDSAVGTYPDPPPGYFDTSLYPWIWAQQVSWQTDSLIADTSGAVQTYALFTNTVESRSIDCHSARATPDDSYSSLFLVVDFQVVNPDYSPYFFLSTMTAGWSVMSKLPAGS